MEQNLFEDHSVYKLLFENAAEGILIVGADGVIRLNNRQAEIMFGYSGNKLNDLPLKELLPARIKPQHKEHLSKYFHSPGKKQMGKGRDLLGRKKNGDLFPIEISLNHFEYSGQFYAMALMTDISERKKIEQELKELRNSLEEQIEIKTRKLEESEILYREVARNFPNGTINVFDEGLNYIFVEGKELFRQGITSDKLVGTNYIQRLPEALKIKVKQKLLLVFKGDNQTFEVDFDRGVFSLSAVALKKNENRIEQILVVEQDITKQKQAEEKIMKALETERELGDLKSRFVSMASHEFRTPLSTILSSSSLALRYQGQEDIEKREKHLKRIQSSVQNMTGILNDFLSLSKLEEEKINLNISTFNLRDLVADIIDELQELKKDGQNFQFGCVAENLEMNSDQNIVRNILNNLLSNAIKYSPENSEIKIHCELKRTFFKVAIQDNGIGIPKKDQVHLFSQFFRATNATNIQGTGLGLNIVKRYLKLLKGNITFKSEENIGSTFLIQLPKNN